jgi:cytochrome c peroxidase
MAVHYTAALMSGTGKCLAAVLLVAGCGDIADAWFCSDSRCEWTDAEWKRVASLANPPPPAADLSNRYWNDAGAIALGHRLYFDTGFSGGATQKDAIGRDSPPARQPVGGPPVAVSCATCHDPARGGGDATSLPGHVSVGAGWTDVNSLTTVNSAYRQLVFWNGRIDSLWGLNVVVAESATTMNGNRLAIAHRIFDVYRAEYEAVFRPFDPAIGSDGMRFPPTGKPGEAAWDTMTVTDQTTINRVLVNWGKAIAAYEYQLVSIDSPFDRFVTAGTQSTAISGAAKRGARLFVGKAACIDCHNGPQLTDEQFHNIGVPQTGVAVPTTSLCPTNADDSVCDCVEGPRCDPWGAREGLRRLQNDTRLKPWLRTGPFSDDLSDTSRGAYFQVPLTDALKGAWRTPSLRNVALTAPYMHDGALATLEDVVWHYNTGGRAATGERIGVPAAQLKPIGLTAGESADLVAFLESLTGAPVDAKWARAPQP